MMYVEIRGDIDEHESGDYDYALKA
jgi:hypothetical protein